MSQRIKLKPRSSTTSSRSVTQLRVFEAFAGYGGASFALKKLRYPHQVVGYSEIDPHAITIYNKNHAGITNYGDITQIDPQILPDFDLFTGGFPCQPFSTAGSGLGQLDARGTLFHDIIRILSHKQPHMILLENVKGLVSKRHATTFQAILSELHRIGYTIDYRVLNTKDYGIPQNRERLWIWGVRQSGLKVDLTPVWSGATTATARPRIADFLDPVPHPNLYLTQTQINHLISKHSINLQVSEPLCLDIYNKKIKTDGLCCTLTEPHHNTIRIVEPPIVINNQSQYVVRKLSTSEHFRLMGFSQGEIDFAGLSYTQLCRRAGNGWDIHLVSLILGKMLPIFFP